MNSKIKLIHTTEGTRHFLSLKLYVGNVQLKGSMEVTQSALKNIYNNDTVRVAFFNWLFEAAGKSLEKINGDDIEIEDRA